jgi:Lipocalin-like domain
MTVTTADDLRANLIGAWTLQSYVSTAIDGSDVVYPLGVDARGIIMYTPDSYMSAQLMRADNAGAGEYRKAHLHDGVLELGPAEPILLDGELRDAKLVWRRT